MNRHYVEVYKPIGTSEPDGSVIAESVVVKMEVFKKKAFPKAFTWDQGVSIQIPDTDTVHILCDQDYQKGSLVFRSSCSFNVPEEQRQIINLFLYKAIVSHWENQKPGTLAEALKSETCMVIAGDADDDADEIQERPLPDNILDDLLG